MFKRRLQFSKTGRARFLSHLDTMRVFRRALTRAQIPVEFSNGFNPHMKISIALPPPLGVESACEMIDIQLEHPVSGLIEKLNAALPEGFHVPQALPLFDINGVTHIVYSLAFDREIENIFDGRPLIIQKKTKKGITDFDIAPYVKNAAVKGYTLTAALSAQNPTVSPTHILNAMSAYYPGIELLSAGRIEMLSADI